MSSTISIVKNKKNALDYNSKSNLYIPEIVYSTYPNLKSDRSSELFFEEVIKVQNDASLGVDGFFGPATQQWLTNKFTSEIDYLVIKGERIPVNTRGLFSITDFTENSKYDLHKYANFSKRKKQVSRFVMHHGGFDIDHLASVFSTTERKVSSHIGMGIDKKTGKIVVAQYLDLNFNAWHAGAMNEGSIGIDFAIQPSIEYASRYNLPIIENPTKIGPSKVLRFPDELIAGMSQLLKELHRIYCLQINPIVLAESKHDAINLQTSNLSVIGHHHFATNGKFDISYIWDRLYKELQTK